MRSIRHFSTSIGVGLLAVAALTGQALGGSRMAFTLELGGNNHAADWKSGIRTPYTRGNPADGQVFYIGELLNYAVVLEASGVHDQPGHDSHGKEIYGAANIVFNIELVDSSNNDVSWPSSSQPRFVSTINNMEGSDPLAPTSFTLSFLNFGVGRLIDRIAQGGPRMEPIYTYPTQPVLESKLIGMGAGYKEWVRSGQTAVVPGVGMVTMPNGGAGFGVVPIAEGQIDISDLTPGATYTLRVIPGNGNNVLRGDLNMAQATNRPAFAVAVNETVGDEITFTVTDQPPVPQGVYARKLFYNNSAWDGNNPGIDENDDNAIAPDKTALLPGQTGSFVNVTSYAKGLNGIMIDIGGLTRVPVIGQDILFLMGNTNDPFTWTQLGPDPSAIQVRWGEGELGTDRVVMTWPDLPSENALPNSTWLLVAISANGGELYPGNDDFFCFGLAIGESSGDLTVNATDELLARNNPHTFLNPAPIDSPYDYNRDRLVSATDQLISRDNATTFLDNLKPIVFP
ncbi:MAG TPA: hypothetical protein PKL76_11900 [Phycisphaerae bacterium]|nr:hypothetical protein [Phycisphaerae bacterium]